jgi:hypothetical protein
MTGSPKIIKIFDSLKKENFDSLKKKFWQFEKENFDSSKKEILTV